VGAIASETRLAQLEAEVERAGVRAQFDKMVADGQGVEFAAMCALQQPPGSKNTDRAFQDGARRRMENMGAKTKSALLGAAQKAGINTAGKFYVGGLGRAQDPSAWVSTAQDVLDVCKKKNLNCEGVVNHKATFRDAPPPDVKLAPDLVREFAANAMDADPGLAERCKRSKTARQELAEKVIEKHGRPKRHIKKRKLAP
jgi:hypothetical protein